MYPQGSVAAQLFGYVTEVSPEQLKRKPVGIKAGDKIGQSGIESRVRRLSPRRGGRTAAARRRARHAARTADSARASRGRATTLLLTIDLRLQKAAQRALAYGIQRARDSNCYGCWDANGGAIVALDPHDGSVLALASAPTYQPSVYAGPRDDEGARGAGADAGHGAREELSLAEPGARRRLSAGVDVQAGHRDRCAPGAPGLAVDAPALHRHVHLAGGPGHQVFNNWDPVRQPGDGSADGARGLVRHVLLPTGQRLLRAPARARPPAPGVGEPARLRTPDRASTSVPSTAACCRRPSGGRGTSRRRLDKLWKPGDSIQLAIGQKDLLVTPMQMARFYALIANGGKLVTPHLLLGVQQTGSGGAAPHPAAPAAQQINIDPAALDVVRRGLLEATHASFGTSSASSAASPSPSRARPEPRRRLSTPVTGSRACSTSRGGAGTGRTTSRRSSSAR